MGDKTKIEWTDATWNPIRGCSRVSTGCEHCYAEQVAHRFSGPGAPYEGLSKNGRWTGKVRLLPEKLDQPLRWQKPRRIFVNSMSDLFHHEVPFEYVAAVFGVMAASPRHTFQVLTKRPTRMLAFFHWLGSMVGTSQPSGERVVAETCPVTGCLIQADRHGVRINPANLKHGIRWPLPNVWLGATAEDQAAADERIPLLLQCPAAVRFVSVEPMVGAVDLEQAGALGCECDRWTSMSAPCSRCDLPWINWVICGGESGPGARPMHPEWARSLRDQCGRAEVPFLFKQWGEWGEPDSIEATGLANQGCFEQHREDGGAPRHEWSGPKTGNEAEEMRGRETMYRVGKKAAGRELDGVIHDGYPEMRT